MGTHHSMALQDGRQVAQACQLQQQSAHSAWWPAGRLGAIPQVAQQPPGLHVAEWPWPRGDQRARLCRTVCQWHCGCMFLVCICTC